MVRMIDQLIFFFNDTATTEIYTLSLHDALPISVSVLQLDPEHRIGQRLDDATLDLDGPVLLRHARHGLPTRWSAHARTRRGVTELQNRWCTGALAEGVPGHAATARRRDGASAIGNCTSAAGRATNEPGVMPERQ